MVIKDNSTNVYYAIYSRKSKYTGKGESIENQIELCKNQLMSKYNIDYNVIKVYQDEGFTGYNTNRPEFQEMMKDIRMGKIRCVIVYRLDRISRNVLDFCNLKNEFLKYNVDFISVTENFDTSTPMGDAMIMISSVFAQLERDTIAERIRDNMYELAKTGRWLGGNTPLGYKSKKVEVVSVDGKKKSLYMLDVVDDEVEKVRLIFSKMYELKGLKKLESYLLQQGIKTRNGNNFTRFSLIAILKNPVYVMADDNIKNFFKEMGVIVYENDSFKCDGKYGLIAYNKREELVKRNYKDISKWIIAVGRHKGIIDSWQFIFVWNLIEKNRDKRIRSPRQNTSVLSGIIRCKYCGSYMRPKLRGKVCFNGKRNFSYICELKDKSCKRLCKCKNIDGMETDELVIQRIMELKITLGDFIKKGEIIYSNIEGEFNNYQNEIQILNARVVRNRMKINRLIDRLAIVSDDLVNDVSFQIRELKDKNKEIEKRVMELSKDVKLDVNNEEISVMAFDIINNYMKFFDRLDVMDKRLMIRSLVSSVVTDGKNIYINYVC